MATIGGIQAVNQSLQRLFRARGDRCEIFSFREAQGARFGRIGNMFSDLRRFLRLSSEPGRQFVFNISGIEILLFSVICLVLRRDFHYWLHGDPEVFRHHASSRILAKFFFKRARAVIVLHRAFGERLGADQARIAVIPNIVPQLHLQPAAGRCKVSRVIWIGRISPEKNPVLAFSAMIALARRFPAIEFLFVSPGQTARVLEQEAPPSNFRFVDGAGFVPAKYFNNSSLHLFTSTLEAMPGVLFESASCHARFVSTRCSPWVDELAALGHGIAVPVDIDAKALVETVSSVLEDNMLVFRTDEVAAFLSGYNDQNVGAMWYQILGAR